MVKLEESKTKTFHCQTEEEHPREFILTFNGESWAVNTKLKFIPTDEVAKALNEAKKLIKKEK